MNLPPTHICVCFVVSGTQFQWLDKRFYPPCHTFSCSSWCCLDDLYKECISHQIRTSFLASRSGGGQCYGVMFSSNKLAFNMFGQVKLCWCRAHTDDCEIRSFLEHVTFVLDGINMKAEGFPIKIYFFLFRWFDMLPRSNTSHMTDSFYGIYFKLSYASHHHHVLNHAIDDAHLSSS